MSSAIRASNDLCDSLVIEESAQGFTTMAYPSRFHAFKDTTASLSASLRAPAFTFHIHDGDFWMYTLFNNGCEVDRFNPIPDYWGTAMSRKELKSWAGNSRVVAMHWPGVVPKNIEKYLVTWELSARSPGKAYNDDAYEYNDCWQLLDFMRRLGLVSPVSPGVDIVGDAYDFDVPDEDLE